MLFVHNFSTCSTVTVNTTHFFDYINHHNSHHLIICMLTYYCNNHLEFSTMIVATIFLYPRTSAQLIGPFITMTEKHKQWLQQIRQVVGDRIINKEGAHLYIFWRYWLRWCWVSQMWQNFIISILPAPVVSGWLHQSDSNCAIDWESPKVQQNIRFNTEFLTKGCSCKKSCQTPKCGCRKSAQNYEPECLCQICTNGNTEEVANKPDPAKCWTSYILYSLGNLQYIATFYYRCLLTANILTRIQY